MTATIKKLDLLILIALIMAALLLSVFIAGCAAPQPETLIDTDTLQVIRTGRETTVSDLAGQQQYKFTTTRARHAEAPTEPQQAIKTETIEIIIYPGGVLGITDYTAGEVYRITPKRGGVLIGREKS